MVKILIIDDDVTFCLMLKTLLEKHGYDVVAVFSPANVKELITKDFYEIILTDLKMPEMNGMDLLRLVKAKSPGSQIVMMTSYADVSTATQSIKEGAFNYIPKPFLPDELLNIINEALTESSENRVQLKHTDKKSGAFFEGNSEVAKNLKKHVELVAPTQLSVLICGESGTGKEIIARSIHEQSSRAGRPFIAVDCGAIPKELVESEFLGHVKGAFTGAISDKNGHFVEANGGTLFLDEVGNLTYNSQIKLLRVLQERKVKPVGSNEILPVDVRIISATNENLILAQEKGNFREDLFHRLNEFQIKIPPLRERHKDIMDFAHFFLKQANLQLSTKVADFDPDVEAVFRGYSWPGNLREIKNVVKRATLLSKGTRISLNEIPPELYDVNLRNENFSLFNEKNETKLILKALEVSGYNKSKAAKLLNIDRKTLYNKLKVYNIMLPEK